MYTPWNDRSNTRKRRIIAIGAAALLVIGGATSAQAALSGNKIGLRVTAEANLTGDDRLSHATLVGPVYVFVGGASTSVTQVKFWVDDATGITAPTATVAASPFVLPLSAAPLGGAAAGTGTSTSGAGTTAGGMAATGEAGASTGVAKTGSETGTGAGSSGGAGSGSEESGTGTPGSETGTGSSASGGADGETASYSGDKSAKKAKGSDSEAKFTANATTPATGSSSSGGTSATGGNGEDPVVSTTEEGPVVPDPTMSTGSGTTPAVAMPTAAMPTAGTATGAAATGTAAVFDTTALADGSHFVLAEVTTSEGIVDLFARFTVQNGGTAATQPTTQAPTQAPKKKTTTAGTSTGTDAGTASKPATGATPAATPAATAGSGTEAATLLGWGTPTVTENMDSKDAYGWYNDAGNQFGKRSSSQASASGGVVTLTGTSGGATAGGAHKTSQQYGRWEVRQKVEGSSCWRPVLLLWPTAENWPVGGEVDFAENGGGNLNEVNFFLHYGASNSQSQGSGKVDMSQWHNYAVEWTADHIRGYIDGKQFFEDTNKSHLPPGPMHATAQLDGSQDCNGSTKQMIDWMKIYKA